MSISGLIFKKLKSFKNTFTEVITSDMVSYISYLIVGFYFYNWNPINSTFIIFGLGSALLLFSLPEIFNYNYEFKMECLDSRRVVDYYPEKKYSEEELLEFFHSNKLIHKVNTYKSMHSTRLYRLVVFVFLIQIFIIGGKWYYFFPFSLGLFLINNIIQKFVFSIKWSKLTNESEETRKEIKGLINDELLLA